MNTVKKIYTLSHPETLAVVYVGRSQDLELRLKAHIMHPSARLRSFIEELSLKNLAPVITEIDKGNNKMESLYIKKYRDQGCQLLNINCNPDPLLLLTKEVFNTGLSNELIGKWRRLSQPKDQAKLARILKLSQPMVSRILSGKQDAKAEIVEKIKDFYDMREQKINEINNA